MHAGRRVEEVLAERVAKRNGARTGQTAAFRAVEAGHAQRDTVGVWRRRVGVIGSGGGRIGAEEQLAAQLEEGPDLLLVARRHGDRGIAERRALCGVTQARRQLL